ncbi:MAG: hypothetical protein D6730_09855 [Bacteroidetes bacterium]|nr:MAG: hypothetical protein D6730_09855 [Bacteroidota bacterium]
MHNAQFLDLTEFLHTPVSFRQLELILLDLPQKEVFRSGIGLRKSRKALIVKWIDADGAFGYGECSCRPDPYYSDEFLEAALLLIRRFVVPGLPGCRTYGELLALHRKIRGWPFTKAAVEFALHDLIMRKHGSSMFQHWHRKPLQRVPIGISLGIQPSADALLESVARAQAAGYRRLKFKISPDTPAAHFLQLRNQLQGAYISFDANGTFYPQHLPALEVYAGFDSMVEQPFPPGRLDFVAQARQAIPQLYICLDEEVKGMGQLISAQKAGALDELNLKPGRVGGLYNSLLIAEYCLQQGIPCWIGGMFETGIGRSLNLRLAAYMTQARAHDLSPSHRYFEKDVLSRPIEMDEAGYINPHNLPTEVDESVLHTYCLHREVLTQN